MNVEIYLRISPNLMHYGSGLIDSKTSKNGRSCCTEDVSYFFSTSDSSSDVLLLSKIRDLENFGSGSGADPHVMCLSQSEAQNREGIGRGLGVDPLPKSCDLSEPIRNSESQNGSNLDPLLIWSWSTPDPLPRGYAPKSHVISLSQSDVP